MTYWDDLAVRARGLGSHLLDRGSWSELARGGASARRTTVLRETPYGAHLPGRAAGPAEVDAAIRGRVARDLEILARWAGPERRGALAVVFHDQDRRNLRALSRGAATAAAPRFRIRGVLPTPTLTPERLEEAAAARDLGELAALAARWEHPLAPALEEQAGVLRPDLFAVERALTEVWADHALGAARGAGGALRDFVAETIDAENLRIGVALTTAPAATGNVSFLEGGRGPSPDALRRVLDEEAAPRRAARVRRAFRGTPFQGLPERPDGGRLEDRILERRIAGLAARARLHPVDVSSVLLFILRLRAEVLGLRRWTWGTALEAPAAAILPESGVPGPAAALGRGEG